MAVPSWSGLYQHILFSPVPLLVLVSLVVLDLGLALSLPQHSLGLQFLVAEGYKIKINKMRELNSEKDCRKF